jgi:hypothetical protein
MRGWPWKRRREHSLWWANGSDTVLCVLCRRTFPYQRNLALIDGACPGPGSDVVPAVPPETHGVPSLGCEVTR